MDEQTAQLLRICDRFISQRHSQSQSHSQSHSQRHSQSQRAIDRGRDRACSERWVGVPQGDV
jgi:hypothetical protein